MEKEDIVKISFLGDITCDRPMLKAARREDGTFDFSQSLSFLKELFRNSDYIVGNLETVFAGEGFGYNPGAITYNSPDDLAFALKEAGISMLTTANNHCLDCGETGVRRTIDILDEAGIEHTGTFKETESDADRFLIKELNGLRIAFVSFADLLNTCSDGKAHSLEEWSLVNNLRKHRKSESENRFKGILKSILPMNIINEIKATQKRSKGIPLVTPRIDNYDINPIDNPQMEWAIRQLERARERSDFVIACVHCGGQFNAEPGRYSVQVYDMLEPYVDAIIGNHPHVIQRMECNNGKVRAYSLGSVNMSPSGDYVSREFLPDYSVFLTIFLKKVADKSVVLEKTMFSLLHVEEDERSYLTVHPVDENYCKKISEINGDKDTEEVKKVFTRFSGKEFSDWKKKYIL